MQVYPDWPWLVPYMQTASLFLDGFRQLIWLYITNTAGAISSIYQGYLDLFKIDFTTLPFVGSASGIIAQILPSLMTICVVLAGVFIIIGSQHVKKELAGGILIAILLITTTPFTFATMGQLTELTTTGMTTIFSNDSTAAATGGEVYDMADYILMSSLVDVLRSANANQVSYLNTDPNYIDINEKVGGYFGNADLFGYKITSQSDGKAYGKALVSDQWILPEMTNEGIYRYNFDYFRIMTLMTILFFGIFFAGIRTAKTLYEIVFNNLIAPLVYATDVSNSGRSKEFIRRIISTYVSLMAIAFLMLLYVKLTSWVLDANNVPNLWAQIFLIIGFTWALIDGPDSLVKLIGIDAGTRGFGAPFVAGAAIFSQVAMAGNSIFRGGHGGGSAAAGASSASENGAASGSSGMSAGSSSNPDKMHQERTQSDGNQHTSQSSTRETYTQDSRSSTSTSDTEATLKATEIPQSSLSPESMAAATGADGFAATTNVQDRSFVPPDLDRIDKEAGIAKRDSSPVAESTGFAPPPALANIPSFAPPKPSSQSNEIPSMLSSTSGQNANSPATFGTPPAFVSTPPSLAGTSSPASSPVAAQSFVTPPTTHAAPPVSSAQTSRSYNDHPSTPPPTNKNERR